MVPGRDERRTREASAAKQTRDPTEPWPVGADPAHSNPGPELSGAGVAVAGWGPTELLGGLHFPVVPGLVVVREEFPCQDTRVSSLWTPSGEHRPSGAHPGAEGEPPPGNGPVDVPSDEEIAAIRQARLELASVPVADVVANHAVGLWQLAMLHLAPEPLPDGTPARPNLAEAGLAIDALAAMVDTLGDRLAPHAEMLRDAVTNLRMAFVQLTDALAAFDAQVAAEARAPGAGDGAARAPGEPG